ncbi:MAG: hypothetical protein GY753_17580 [Gammaproteobacteria bacterium]|nr:hypothetical protein [Gammaproteobacteria bacterium]
MRSAATAKSKFLSPMLMMLLVGSMMVSGLAQALTQTYILDNVFLNSTQQMTGTFVWNYDVGDFEGGSVSSSEFNIPTYSFGVYGSYSISYDIKKSIEFSMDGNFHDTDFNISLVFLNPLTPTSSALLDTVNSKWTISPTLGTNGLIKSGSIMPVTSAVPIPPAVWLFGSGLLGLIGLYKRKRAV